MDAISYSDARRRFPEVIAQAKEKPVFITKTGDETMVIMTAAELSSIMETAYLLSTEANRDSLARSLEEYKAGKFVQVSIDDL